MRYASQIATLLFLAGAGYAAYAQKHNNAVEPEAFFRNILSKMSEKCNEAAEYITKDDKYSRTVMEAITFREPAYRRILKDAQQILCGSEAAPEFEAIDKLWSKNRELKNEITELKQKRLIAPYESSNPFADTRSKIDNKIYALENDISKNEVQVEEIKSKILHILGETGISLKREELDYFLISAEGSDVVKLMTVANNMKRMQIAIENELQSDPNNIQLAKVYTGMYLVSLEAYSHAHSNALANIRKYLIKLFDIEMEAKENYETAIALKNEATERDLSHIESNINLNLRTLEIISAYRNLLERRIENLRKSDDAVCLKVEIARNTYNTLENGSTLISLINQSSDEYSLLMDFEMPELKSIYDTGMLSAFIEISERIKSE